MFQNILVALDRSAASTRVFDEALHLAKKTGADLMLLHVLSTEDDGSPDVLTFPPMHYYSSLMGTSLEKFRQQWEAVEADGIKFLQMLTDEATEAGVQTEFTQHAGSPGRVICEVADRWDADLIVMGRRGLSGVREALVGSSSNYVMHRAACSVLLVQPLDEVGRSPQVTEPEMAVKT